MEVHPPHAPIHSMKEFLVHMLAITLGLLIALGLEAAVEWLHHRNLVREARANIVQEMRDNQRNLAAELKVLPTEKNQLKAMLEMTSDLQHAQSYKAGMPEFQWTVTRLSDAAWSTAGSSGALAHMSYAEARRYAQIYSLQEMFNTTMGKYVETRGEMYAFLNRLELPEKPSETAFESGEQLIEKGVIISEFLREIGASLDSDYTGFLSKGETEASSK